MIQYYFSYDFSVSVILEQTEAKVWKHFGQNSKTNNIMTSLCSVAAQMLSNGHNHLV